jgi:hypothetical protein
MTFRKSTIAAKAEVECLRNVAAYTLKSKIMGPELKIN